MNSNNVKFLLDMRMIKLECRDYGFNCNFVSEGNESSKVTEEFGKHTLEEHGIEYRKEVLMQFVLRKGRT